MLLCPVIWKLARTWAVLYVCVQEVEENWWRLEKQKLCVIRRACASRLKVFLGAFLARKLPPPRQTLPCWNWTLSSLYFSQESGESEAPDGEIKPVDCTTGTPCLLLPARNAARAERESERKTRSEAGTGKKDWLPTYCSVLVLSGELHHCLSCLFLSLQCLSASGIQTAAVCQTDLDGGLKNNSWPIEIATSHHLKHHPAYVRQLLTCRFGSITETVFVLMFYWLYVRESFYSTVYI